jgi:hypothetical protein
MDLWTGGVAVSEYQDFLNERDKIDFLIQMGFKIERVTENLSGAFVLFKNTENKRSTTLHVKTANARKYFSNLLIKG